MTTFNIIRIPEGLEFFENVIETESLEEYFNSIPFSKFLFPVSSSVDSRKVAHFGFVYNYNNGGVNQKADPLPQELEILTKILKQKRPSINYNQCIINRYLPGQGIGSHIDSLHYGDSIACFTFGSGYEIEFNKNSDNYKIYTKPGSLYIMEKESRYIWKHQIRYRLNDPQGKRGVRWSVTFRSIKK